MEEMSCKISTMLLNTSYIVFKIFFELQKKWQIYKIITDKIEL